jgi:hypothetical protein
MPDLSSSAQVAPVPEAAPVAATVKPSVDDMLPLETAAQRRFLMGLSRLVYQEWASSYPAPPARFHQVPRPVPVHLSFVNGSIPVDADPEVVRREREASASVDLATTFLTVMRADHYIAPTLAAGSWAADSRQKQFIQTVDRTAFLARELPGLPFVPTSSPNPALLDPLGDRIVQLKTLLLMNEAHQAGRVTIGSWGRLAGLPNCLNDPDPLRFLFYISAAAHHAGAPASTDPGWGACWAELLPDPVLKSARPGRRYESMRSSWNTTNARFLMDRSLALGWPRPEPEAMHWAGSSVDWAVLLLSLWVARPMSPMYKSSWGSGLTEDSDQDGTAGPEAAARWTLEKNLRAKTNPWSVLPPSEAPRVLAWAMGLPVDTFPKDLATHPQTELVLNGLRHRLRAHQRGTAKNRFLWKNRFQLDLFQARLEALPGWCDHPKNADMDLTTIQHRLPNGVGMPQSISRVPADAVPTTNARALGLEFAHPDLWIELLKDVAVAWQSHRADAASDAGADAASAPAFTSPDWTAAHANLSQARLFRPKIIHYLADLRDKFIAVALPLMGPEGPSGLIRMEHGDTAVHQAARGNSGTPPSVSLFQKILMRARTYGPLSELTNNEGKTPLSFLDSLTPSNRSRYDKVLLKEVVTAHRKPLVGPKAPRVQRVRPAPPVPPSAGASSEVDPPAAEASRPVRKPKRLM